MPVQQMERAAVQMAYVRGEKLSVGFLRHSPRQDLDAALSLELDVGCTYRVGMVVADVHEVHAAGHGGGHHVASGLVEDWRVDAWVRRAQRLVVAEDAI